ncbi:MAG: AAA family ATPase, partial [Caldilineaceae bacterium]|nr:AAA family ATPase [Caldilineaceae bacterium]
MARLLLTCFDRFHVALDGKSLTAFQTDKVRALLVYLAVEPQAHSRSALAQFLWPGYSEESANSSLRQTLYRLRQLLQDAKAEPPWLLITRQTVQLNPAAPLQGDVITFLRLLADCVAHGHADLTNCPPCLARLEEAIDLYQGDFLADFTIADSDPFEEWRRITQEQLHLQMVDALTELGNAAELRGNDEVALQAAQRHLGLEPWLETVHRRVMRIFARRGQRAAALAQYQRCCQILADEFGIEPEQETVALYEEIQRGSTRGRREQKPQLVGAQQVERPVLAGAIPQRANLPLAATPFIGRDQALVDLVAQLQRPEVRLLTIVGIGGMGKTRLAIELGRTVQARFADGICFVELAAVRTPTALASAIATALGIPLQGVEPHKLLLQALREQQMLLILDNFEQLLSQEATPGPTAVDLLLDLLMTAPALQILVTSRERLRLRQEQIYTVQALEFVPDAKLADVTQIAAVRLFVQAAQRIQAHFQVTAENLPPLLRICQLVQGMPLGLELAAAHVDQLPLVEIADAIAQSAAFLAVDWRDLPERQRSMGAVFQWSWRLLDEQERQVFRQLAVFQGSFTRTAAETIAGATLPVLTRLLHKSLLQVNEPGA